MENRAYDYPCPRCVSPHETLMDTLGNEDKEAGRIPKDAVMNTEQAVMSTSVKRKVSDKVSVAVVFSDICLGCGQVYVKRIVFTETTIQASTQQPGMPKIHLPGNNPQIGRSN